jgi:hypothetical protein
MVVVQLIRAGISYRFLRIFTALERIRAGCSSVSVKRMTNRSSRLVTTMNDSSSARLSG